MTNGTDQPTPDELASELEELETAAGNADTGSTEPETAPASEPAPEAPADPAPAQTIAPPLNTAQADKKAADTTRRKETIAASPTPDTSVEDAEDKRKAGIYEKLETVQGELVEALAAVDDCKARARELMAELYPHAQESDKLVDAVRGHIKAQKRIRASRATNPARIAEILKAAGRSPIDNAFHVQRARGMGRPTRSQAKPAADDSGGGSDANAGSE